MAHLDIGDTTFTLRLATWEKIASVMGDWELPLADIESVEVVDRAWRRVHGIRVGFGLPAVLVSGTFGGDGDGQTVAVCHGNGPGVVVTMRGVSPTRVILTVDDPEPLASRLRTAAHLAG